MVRLDVSQDVPLGVRSVLALVALVVFDLFVHPLDVQLHLLPIAEILLTNRAGVAGRERRAVKIHRNLHDLIFISPFRLRGNPQRFRLVTAGIAERILAFLLSVNWHEGGR